MTKKCGTCQLDLPRSMFTRDSSRRDGLRSRCRDCLRAKAAERYARDKGEASRRNAGYYAQNQARLAAKSAAYQRSNPHINWESKYRQRALRAGFTPVVEPFTREDVVDAYGDRCAYCDTGAFESLDHFIPVSAGGPHVLSNVRPCCIPCNSTKGATVPVDSN